MEWVVYGSKYTVNGKAWGGGGEADFHYYQSTGRGVPPDGVQLLQVVPFIFGAVHGSSVSSSLCGGEHQRTSTEGNSGAPECHPPSGLGPRPGSVAGSLVLLTLLLVLFGLLLGGRLVLLGLLLGGIFVSAVLVTLHAKRVQANVSEFVFGENPTLPVQAGIVDKLAFPEHIFWQCLLHCAFGAGVLKAAADTKSPTLDLHPVFLGLFRLQVSVIFVP